VFSAAGVSVSSTLFLAKRSIGQNVSADKNSSGFCGELPASARYDRGSSGYFFEKVYGYTHK
jgi:hypothetical protein